MRRVRLGHLVEEQMLVVDVGLGLAEPALLDRVGEMNRRRFVPVIEQVLDEFDMSGECTRLAAVQVSLGSFAPDSLHHAEIRLRDRLRAALAAALDGAAPPEREARALVTAFEQYLLRGTWPIGSAIAPDTMPKDLLAQLLAEDPLALVAMLRRRGSSDLLLRRLVRQMPGTLLAALLHRLEPVHAAYVLAYLDEVRERHAIERLIPASPVQLAEMLWMIVLRDALQQPGLHANRKVFLLRLLKQLARSGGTTPAALIAQLRRGLPRILARRRAPGSLVAVLGELITDEPELLANEFGIADLAAFLGRRTLSTHERREAARLAEAADPRQLRWLLRRLAGEDPVRLAEAIEGVLTLGRVLGAIWSIDAEGLPAAIDALAQGRTEQGALLALAAHSAERPEIAHRLAAALIARVRGVTADRIDLSGARKASARRGAQWEAAARLAAALAEAPEHPSPSERAHIRKLLADAIVADPLATRQMLRNFAAADPRRLCLLFGKADAPDAVAKRLLAPHLYAALAAFARAARCSKGEWRVLLRAAAGTAESDLPETLLAAALGGLARLRRMTVAALRNGLDVEASGAGTFERDMLAWLRATSTRRARRLASRHAALEQFALFWSGGNGLAQSENAAMLARLLPRLSGLAPDMLRARLSDANRSGANDLPPHLWLLPGPALLRLALLLAAHKARLRALPPQAMPFAVAALLKNGNLVSFANTPPEAVRDARGHAEDAPFAIGSERDPARLARLSRRELLRMLAALAPRGTRAAAWVRRRLAGAVNVDAEARALVIALARGEASGNAAAWTKADSAGRGRARGAGDLRLEALAQGKRSGSRAAGTRPDSAERGHARGVGDLRLAALIRARPFAALRTLAGIGDVPVRLIPLLQDAQTLPLVFASAAPAERARGEVLMRILTSRKGRLAVAPAKLARALALAAAARDWRSGSGRGFTAEWLRHLFALATLSEQAALRRVFEQLPAEERIDAPQRRKQPEEEIPQGIAGQVRAMLALGPNASLSQIRRALEEPRRRRLLACELSEVELVQLLMLLAPAVGAGLLHAAERLAAARRTGGAPLARTVQWECILAATGARHPVPRLTSLFLDGAEGIPAPPAPARARIEWLLSASLEGMRDAPLKIALDLRERDRKRRAAEARIETPSDTPTAIHIANAGLVLASAFLPRLFQSLAYVVPDGNGGWRWSKGECRGRAVHLLQWLVDTRTDAPEPQLALNKVLCGMAVAEPAPTDVALTDPELRMGGTLLATILASWPPLAGSSTDALRQTYFQREGRLARSEQGWSLEVETRVLDILLDQLPWGFSTILHPWMPAPLTVQWR